MVALEAIVTGAVDALASSLRLERTNAGSHQVIILRGLEAPELLEPLATYVLAAGIGQVVGIDLAISADLLGSGPAFEEELRTQVERVLGANCSVSEEFRRTRRDPWITECLAHLLLKLSSALGNLDSSGALISLTSVHTDVTAHGIDLLGLRLRDMLLTLDVTEVKASEDDPSRMASDTAGVFSEVDEGKRDPEIRQKVQLLRTALSEAEQALVTASFWRGGRVFMAVVSYGSRVSFTPSTNRPAYASLASSPDAVRLLAIPIADFRRFYDSLADRVRALVPRISGTAEH